MSLSAPAIPKAFKWRRWHSLTGLWLVLFLIFHLLANSQAALWVGDSGSGFVKVANDIRLLPYLEVIEIVFLGIPFFIHTVWGVKYFFTSKYNSYKTDGTEPSLEEYSRNHGYTWQRITSWLLLFLIAFHVIQMRFMEAPIFLQEGQKQYYFTRLEQDPGLATLAERLNVKLFNQIPKDEWNATFNKLPLQSGQVVAVANDFGTAELLMVRETFKKPAMLFLYTVLVLSACFHAFNGLWTFLITWGVTLSVNSQKLSRRFATFLMAVITFLGLAAIWGTYWINLKQ